LKPINPKDHSQLVVKTLASQNTEDETVPVVPPLFAGSWRVHNSVEEEQ
jgi:hypothetical protein